MMSPISSAIIAAEIVSTLVLIIVSISIYSDTERSKTNRYFNRCVIVTVFILISDIISYTFDGRAGTDVIQFIGNYNTFIFGDFLMVFFALYVYSFVNERVKTRKTILYVTFVICLIDAIFETYGAFNKLTFSITDSVFVPGELYSICFVTQLVVLFSCLLYLIANVKKVGFKTLMIFFLYYVLPVCAIILILINDELSFICTSIAISFLIIYIGIEKRSKEIFMNELLNKDILTGLHNRNAYEKVVNDYTNTTNSQHLGIIFCDLNGLKTTNDNLGHMAGDELICMFAKLLVELFGDNNYRISGDEFITIFKDIKEDDFNNNIKKLEELINSYEDIASYGYAYGQINDVRPLIIASEKKMYEYKTNYYLTHGIERRK